MLIFLAQSVASSECEVVLPQTRRASLPDRSHFNEPSFVSPWKVQIVGARRRYASELGLHVEVGPLIIATPCDADAAGLSTYIIPPWRVQCTHF